MRIWFVPFEELADAHVLGQHKEWGLMNAMLNSERFVRHPLVTFFGDKRHWLADLHDRTVEEMDHRFDHFQRHGDRHPTPVPSGYYGVGLRHWDIPYDFILYDLIDLAQRYQRADREAPLKYKWTKRPRPEWTLDKVVRHVRLNDMPVQQYSWYGRELFAPFAADTRTRKAVESFRTNHGWLIDEWLATAALEWPYFGTYGTPPWRE